MKRKKNKNSFPARYLLLVLCGICLIVMFLAYSVGGTSGGPLNSVASYIFVPMQKGINSVGTFFSNKSDRFQTLESVMDENTKLKEQVEKLSTELNTVKLEQYELEDLRELYKLDQKYPNYKKVAANVIGKDSGNWFNVFLIDKGKKDGSSRKCGPGDRKRKYDRRRDRTERGAGFRAGRIDYERKKDRTGVRRRRYERYLYGRSAGCIYGKRHYI